MERLVDIPSTREAPDAIRRALRALDPTAEVIYLGWGRWGVGRVRPTNHSIRIATNMLATYWQSGAAARASRRGIQRYRFALACLQGYRPVAEYTLRELDYRVVKDFQESQWRMLHQRGDLLEEMFTTADAQREGNRELFRDEHAAKNVLDYGRTSNFGYAVSSVASSRPDPVPSGRTRHSIPA